jgi:hypothetical protein
MKARVLAMHALMHFILVGVALAASYVIAALALSGSP